jgi:hypothetical protein
MSLLLIKDKPLPQRLVPVRVPEPFPLEQELVR